VKIIYDINAPEIFKYDASGSYQLVKHYWKCRRVSNSSPPELVMYNRDETARNKEIVSKHELGSYNTELLFNYLDITGPLPLYQHLSSRNKREPVYTKPNNWQGDLVFVESMIDPDQNGDDWKKEIQYFSDFCSDLKKNGVSLLRTLNKQGVSVNL
jgi:hypothetical protein